jgi:hypothetical protein
MALRAALVPQLGAGDVLEFAVDGLEQFANAMILAIANGVQKPGDVRWTAVGFGHGQFPRERRKKKRYWKKRAKPCPSAPAILAWEGDGGKRQHALTLPPHRTRMIAASSATLLLAADAASDQNGKFNPA